MPLVMLWCTTSAFATSSNRERKSLGRLEVDGDVALAALAAKERRANHAHAVAGDGFDLDHVHAEITQEHRTEGTGEVLPEVDEDQAIERAPVLARSGERADAHGGIGPRPDRR